MGSSNVRWLTRQLELPLVLPIPQPDQETQVCIIWAGEMWLVFVISVVGVISRGVMVTNTSIGDTVISTEAPM